MFPSELLLKIGVHCDEGTMYNLFHTTRASVRLYEPCRKLKCNSLIQRVDRMKRLYLTQNTGISKFKLKWLLKVSQASYHLDFWEYCLNKIDKTNQNDDEFDTILTCFAYRKLLKFT
jgi:hypothetical protein